MKINMRDVLPGDLCDEYGVQYVVLFRTEYALWVKEVDPLPFGVWIISDPSPIWPDKEITILQRGVCCPLPQARQWIEQGVYSKPEWIEPEDAGLPWGRSYKR